MFVYARKVGEIGLWTAVVLCVLPFIIPDLLKIGLVLAVNKKIGRIIQ